MPRPGIGLTITGGGMALGGAALMAGSVEAARYAPDFEIFGVSTFVAGLGTLAFGVNRYLKHLRDGLVDPQERDRRDRRTLLRQVLCYASGGGRVEDSQVQRVKATLRQEIGLELSDTEVRRDLEWSVKTESDLSAEIQGLKYLYSIEERQALLRSAAVVASGGERLSAEGHRRLLWLGAQFDLGSEETARALGTLAERAPPPVPAPPPAAAAEAAPAAAAPGVFPAAAWKKVLLATGLPGLPPSAVAWRGRTLPGTRNLLMGLALAALGVLGLLYGDFRMIGIDKAEIWFTIGAVVTALAGAGLLVFSVAQLIDHLRSGLHDPVVRNADYFLSVLATVMAHAGHADAGPLEGRIDAFAGVLRELTGLGHIPDADKAFGFYDSSAFTSADLGFFSSQVPALSDAQRAYCLAGARRVAGAENPVTRAGEARLARIAKWLELPGRPRQSEAAADEGP